MIMTKREIAEFFKVKDLTITRWEKNGMPVMRAHGGDPRYDSDDIVAWMKGKPEEAEPKGE